MFIAAGVLCLLQSVVGAFSGVTLGFVIPGIVLVAMGLERAPTASPRPTRRRARAAGVLVVGLGIAAWIIPFATSETVCWIARAGPDGNPVYTRIADTDTISVGVGDLAGGCDGGTFTLQGLMVGGVLATGALAMAALAASRPKDSNGAIA